MRRNLWIAGGIAFLLATLLAGAAWATKAVQAREPIEPRNRLPNHVARGTVESVDGENVMLSTENGNLEVRILDSTMLWVPGEPPTSMVQLAIGDPVLAFGQHTEDEVGFSTFSARLVLVADDEELPHVLLRGRALAVTRQTIVVQSGNRERAITVLPRTRLWSTSGRLDSLRDILPDDTLIALGQPTELGQWVAGLVLVTGAEETTRQGLRGAVVGLDVEELTLAIETKAGSQIAVLTGADTRIRISGVETASFGDIAEGDHVAVLGRFDPEAPDVFLARAIRVLAAPDQAED